MPSTMIATFASRVFNAKARPRTRAATKKNGMLMTMNSVVAGTGTR